MENHALSFSCRSELGGRSPVRAQARLVEGNISTMSIRELSLEIDRLFPDLGYGEKIREHQITGGDFVRMGRRDFRGIGIPKYGHMCELRRIAKDSAEHPDSPKVKNGLRVTSWIINEGKDGNFYLEWEPLAMNAPDIPGDIRKVLQAGRSNPVVMYDNFNDNLEDDENLFLVEDSDHDRQRQPYKELRKVIGRMNASPKVKYIGRTKVYVTMDVQFIDVNSSKETFGVNCETNVFWNFPKLIEQKKAKYTSEDCNQYGELPIQFRSGVQGLPVDPEEIIRNSSDAFLVSQDLTFNPVTEVVHLHLKHTAVLEEQFELARFPFDRQLLHIFVKVNTGDYNPIETPPKAWLLPKRFASQSLRFEVQKKVSNEYAISYHPQDQQRLSENNTLEFKVRAQRHVLFYAINVFFPLFVVVSLASTTFLIEPSLIDKRVNFVIIPLLTTVAFQLTVDGSMPTLSYVTLIHAYVALCVVILLLVTLETMLVHSADEEQAKAVDLACFSLFLLIWFLAHIVFVVLAVSGGLHQSWSSVDAQNEDDVDDVKALVHKTESRRRANTSNAELIQKLQSARMIESFRRKQLVSPRGRRGTMSVRSRGSSDLVKCKSVYSELREPTSDGKNARVNLGVADEALHAANSVPKAIEVVSV
mmetsp:Transcript_7169/g.13369  ORF Transcript_7169/g.13369 Transcript_7169/m.13369 type:complete len:645 (-) Transcript_7169:116-2050(-)